MSVSYSLTDTDLQRLCPDAPITLYPDLPTTDISRVLGPTGCGFVLFVETQTPESTNGHWLALLRKGNAIEMFDPYGAQSSGDPWFLDHTFVPSSSLRALHESIPTMSVWIKQHGCVPTSNPYRLQVMKRGINTCGRHAAARVMNGHFDVHGYYRYVMHYCHMYNCDPDELVTLWTSTPSSASSVSPSTFLTLQ